MDVQTVGLKRLNDEEKRDFREIFLEHSNKIGRRLKNISLFIFHFKEYDKKGTRKKFSIHARIIAPVKRIFEATALDWDFRRTLYKVFNKFENEIEHRFHMKGRKKA